MWYYRYKIVEQPKIQQPTEPASIALVVEEQTPNEPTLTPSSEPAIKEVNRAISVKNNITEKMLSYKKGFLSYVPEFKVVVNGIPLAQGGQQTFEIPDNILNVTYSYDFVNGYKTGTRTVIFSIPNDMNEVDITFDWKNDWRVVIDGAKPLEIIE
jgi:hypothetical protein